MKNFTLFSGKRFIVRLALAATMIVFGGEKVWAEDIVVVDGNSIASGWTNGVWSKKFKYDNGGSTYPGSTSAFDTSSPGALTPLNTWTWYSIYSDNVVQIDENQYVEIVVSRYNSSNYAELVVGYTSNNTSASTTASDFTTEVRVDSEVTLQVNNIPTGENYLQFFGKAIYIKSIKIIEETSPVLSISPNNIEFFTVLGDSTQSITVSNDGVGVMDVTIANSNTTDFTISEPSLTGIEAGDTLTFDITFNYNSGSLGAKSAEITITPNEGVAKTITVLANSVTPQMLWEEFSGEIPSSWYNQDNSWSTSASGHTGEAYQSNNSSNKLRTPRLTAAKDERISFDVKIGGISSSHKIKAEYSTNRTSWTTIGTYTASGTQSFTAPSAGDYWIQFTGYQSSIDNLAGWNPSEVTHEVKLGTATISTSGIHHGTYTASVNVMELGGSNETLTAKLYFGTDVVATKVVSISGNRDETISLSYTPTEAWSGKVYIEITGDNIERLTTSQKTVNITNPTVVLDEGSHESNPTCYTTVIQFKYTPKPGWGTICVPFVLTTDHMNTIFGEEWAAYELKSFSEGQLTFTAASVGTVSKPYLIYSPHAESSVDGFYLQGVSIITGNWSSSNLSQTKNGVTFQGTFDSVAAGSLTGKYGVTASGQIAKGSDKAWMNGYRAYLTGIPDGSSVKMFVIDGDDATDVGLMQMVEGEDKAVYNISGQRVQKARKGLYIIGGKKVIIK